MTTVSASMSAAGRSHAAGPNRRARNLVPDPYLAVTVGVLLWLHQRRPAAFPLVRTSLLLASALALVGYLVFPTAPPRLSGIGIIDTVSGDHIDLNKGLVSSLYNPYAAVPSMHVGYALVVGASLLRYGRRRVPRFIIGAPYPLFVLLVVVATGNHFLFDALAGAAVAGLAPALRSCLQDQWRTPDSLDSPNDWRRRLRRRLAA